MDIDNLATAVVENLQRSSSILPSSVHDLWWLVSAVGYGRLLRHNKEVQAELRLAESVLAEVPGRLRAGLREALDWDGYLEQLAIALKEVRPEDVEAALAGIEELLVVAETTGANERAETFLQEAKMLMACVPPEWTHLVDHAAQRSSVYGISDNLVLRLWEAVEDAAVGVVMREVEPTMLPRAYLYDKLIPESGDRRYLRRP